ncbi:hypothetical protein Ciccas_007770, partial [Cichlidogyrus casuarinus]
MEILKSPEIGIDKISEDDSFPLKYDQMCENYSTTLKKYNSVVKLASSLALRLGVLGFKFDGDLPSLKFSHDCADLLTNHLEEEETDSSSDEELDTISICENDHYYCARGHLKSNWFYLQTEMLKAENCINNIKKLISSYESWKSKQVLSETGQEEDSCARTRSVNSQFLITRPSYINLASRRSARILSPWT